MALMTFQAGMEIDVATGDELNGATKKILDSHRRPKPIHLTLAGVSNATSPNVVYLGAPPIGRAWKVQNYAIVGADPWAPLSGGLATLCIGDYASPTLYQVRDPGNPIPFSDTANGEIWAMSGEGVYWWLNTQAAAVQCTGVLAVEEWAAGDVFATFDRYSGA